MKKHHIYLQIIAFVFACTIMQGCQKEDETEGRVTLNAVLSDDYAADSKAHIRGTQVYWDDNDSININGSRYKIKVTGESVRSARLDTVRYNADGYAAVYPAGMVTGVLSAGSANVTVSIPSIQYMTPGQTQNVKGLMVAKMAGDGTSLVFHNAGAVLDLSVKNEFSSGNDLKLYRIVVSSSAHGLSGDGTLTIDGTAPTYSLSSAAGTPLTLDMENDTIAYNATKSYYIPIPSYTEDGGTQFSVTIYATCGDDHYRFSRSSNEGLTVARNKRVPVDVTLDADPSGYETTTIAGNTGLMGSGTEADPYVIATLKDLDYFKSQVNEGNTYSGKYIRQTADIDASVSNTVDWTPIGTSSSVCFQGTYDGGGHEITMQFNPTAAYYGFFSYLKNAIIKNIIVRGRYTSLSRIGYIGALCGDASGTLDVKNCHNYIPFEGSKYMGGLVGSAVNLSMSHCTNNVNLKGAQSGSLANFGGLVGYVKTSINISDCKNTGNIDGTSQVGGIVGFGPNGTYNRCINEGTVTARGASHGYAGIIGYLSVSATGTVINCKNCGAITGYQAVGGIVGRAQNSGTVNIFNCYNTGDTKATYSNTISSNYAGGICGYINTSNQITINNCFVDATLTKVDNIWASHRTSINSNSYCYINVACTTSANQAKFYDNSTGKVTSSTTINGNTYSANTKKIQELLQLWVDWKGSSYSSWKSRTDTIYPKFSWEK